MPRALLSLTQCNTVMYPFLNMLQANAHNCIDCNNCIRQIRDVALIDDRSIDGLYSGDEAKTLRPLVPLLIHHAVDLRDGTNIT